MTHNYIRPTLLIFISVLLPFLSSCSVSTPEPTSLPTIEPTATIAPTVPGPTYTPTLTELPTSTATLTPTFTLEPTLTFTPESTQEISFGTTQTPTLEATRAGRPQITPIENTNCHLKPKKESETVGYFLKGTVMEIYGRDTAGIWVKIPNPTEEGFYCWVWTGNSKITGSLDNVPVNP